MILGCIFRWLNHRFEFCSFFFGEYLHWVLNLLLFGFGHIGFITVTWQEEWVRWGHIDHSFMVQTIDDINIVIDHFVQVIPVFMKKHSLKIMPINIILLLPLVNLGDYFKVHEPQIIDQIEDKLLFFSIVEEFHSCQQTFPKFDQSGDLMPVRCFAVD